MSTNPDVMAPQRRTTSENIANIREAVGDIARTEREHLHEVYARGKEHAKEAQLSFEDHVRRHPLRSILIAAGAGALVGLLIGRGR